MIRQDIAATEDTLDPADWEETRRLAHRMVDDAIDNLEGLRDRPVWQEMPEAVRGAFSGPAPKGPQPLDTVYDEVTAHLMPHAMGNHHPRFWMWYMGAGSFTGALGDFLAAIEGSNLGGGNTAAALVDRQVTAWISEMMGFPEGASGTLVHGGSMANIIGLMAARNAKAGVDLRTQGVGAMPAPLRFYASDQVHNCHEKAMNLLGLGKGALCKVPTNAALQMDVAGLKAVIAADRAAGIRPACVIATAGTTNTGSIDDLAAIADLCAAEGIWMHVDGCVGAPIAIAPVNRHLVTGIARADSLALDLHKGFHAPFDVGCALLRDRRQHRLTFAENAEYLQTMSRGIAAAEFLSDYSLDTSRGFRALKVWLMLREHGTDKFGRLIDQGIAQAQYLSGLIAQTPLLEQIAPVATAVVCLRFNPGGLDEAALRALNIEIMVQMQEAGLAALSDTTVKGRHCLRVAICNHRTRRADLDQLVRHILDIGTGLATRNGAAGS